MRSHFLDYIDIYRWDNIVDREFEYGKPFEFPCCNCIIKVHPDQIVPFFKRCEAEKPAYKYVILSPRSDFGIDEQAKAPVNADLAKRISFIPWQKVAEAPDYVQIPLGPACDIEHCKITDKYSVKCYAHTCGTFNEIPSCVHHWFCVNSNIKHGKMTCIPMGLGDGKDAELIHNLVNTPRTFKFLKKFYLNFTSYTQERADLKTYYKQLTHESLCGPQFATIVESEKPKLEYYNDILDHKYTLCPNGNGLDCYRNLEVLYLGGVPVVKASVWSESLRELFLNRAENLFDLKEDYSRVFSPNPRLLNFSYWEQLIYDKLHEVE